MQTRFPAPLLVARPARPLAQGLRWLVALGGLVLAGLCWTGLLAADLAPPARASLGVTSLAVGLWGSELVALPVTAFLAVVLLFVTGAAARLEQAFVGFSSPVLFFLLGTAALGIAAEHTGLADRLATWLLARSRGSGRRLLLELLLSLPLQALVVPSAISRNAILVPVYERVLDRLGRPPRLGAAVMLTLGVLGPVASSAVLSGGTSPVATAQLLGGFTWLTWFVTLAPPYYVLLALGGLGIWLLHRPEPAHGLAVPDALARAGPWSAAERRVALVTAGTAALWMLDYVTHWPPAVPAMLALVVLLLPCAGVLDWHTFITRAPWDTCIVLAGAVSLAEALTQTGAAAWVAQALFARFGASQGVAGIALAIILVTALITLAIPNRAAAITLMIPLATAYAAAGPLSGVAAGLIVMMVVDAETLYPAQTAANLLAYARGYFSAGQLVWFDLWLLGSTAAVVLGVALPWWGVIGLPAGR
jgi:sodium-dependent dicarboxylate transporter 2/3/5